MRRASLITRIWEYVSVMEFDKGFWVFFDFQTSVSWHQPVLCHSPETAQLLQGPSGGHLLPVCGWTTFHGSGGGGTQWHWWRGTRQTPSPTQTSGGPWPHPTTPSRLPILIRQNLLQQVRPSTLQKPCLLRKRTGLSKFLSWVSSFSLKKSCPWGNKNRREFYRWNPAHSQKVWIVSCQNIDTTPTPVLLKVFGFCNFSPPKNWHNPLPSEIAWILQILCHQIRREESKDGILGVHFRPNTFKWFSGICIGRDI